VSAFSPDRRVTVRDRQVVESGAFGTTYSSHSYKVGFSYTGPVDAPAVPSGPREVLVKNQVTMHGAWTLYARRTTPTPPPARMIAPRYARADDEARSLLREIFPSAGHLQTEGGQLPVRIRPLSAPRRTRAMAAPCEGLTATETFQPGVNLTLVSSVKEG
jgi:hypothetical protein